jgi:hypothetical protein
MKQSILAGFFLLATVTAAGSAVAAADPSMHEVYQAAQSGHLKQAEAMMDQVLKDHPNSGKAHYVEAEILAKEGRMDAARTELANADRLAPGLPFAKPESVRELRALVAQPAARLPAAVAPAAAAPAAAAHGTPWGMWLLAALLIAAVVFFVRSLMRPRIIPAPNYGGTAYGPGPQPYGVGGVGPMAPTGGMGSGILGGLATGAAMGAGVVAGEALMHHLMDGNSAASAAEAQAQPLDAGAGLPGDDMGGSDFGVADGGSWDDGSSMGGGSDDWS